LLTSEKIAQGLGALNSGDWNQPGTVHVLNISDVCLNELYSRGELSYGRGGITLSLV